VWKNFGRTIVFDSDSGFCFNDDVVTLLLDGPG